MRARLVRVRGAGALRRRDRGLHPHGVDRPHVVALGDGRAPLRVGRVARARRAGDGADRPRRAPPRARSRAHPRLPHRRPSRAAREHRRARAGDHRRRRGGRRHPARVRSPRCTRASGASWSAIAFVEEGRMAIGPLIGTRPTTSPHPRSPCRSSTAATPSPRSGSGARPPRHLRPSSSAPRRCSRRSASSAGTPAARSGCREGPSGRLDPRRPTGAPSRRRAGSACRRRRRSAPCIAARCSSATWRARPAGFVMPVNLKSKSSPAAVSKSTSPTPSMRSRKLW